MDLFMELGTFVRPQHQRLICERVKIVQQSTGGFSGGVGLPGHLASGEPGMTYERWNGWVMGPGSVPTYWSTTVDYLTKVHEEVDAETWKLLHTVLERYYSNPNDLLIQVCARSNS